MNIQLKRIQHVARMSEETECFVADLWVNGIKRGQVSNKGHGGCTMFSDWAAQKEINEYAKTLPNRVTNFTSPATGKPFEYQQDAESLVDDLLQKHLSEKQIKNWCKRKTVLRMKDAPDGSYEFLAVQWDAKLKDAILKKFPNVVEIVNERFQ